MRPTPMQVAMVFASIRDPEAGNYVQQLRIKLNERSECAVWRTAFQMAIERHESLRSVFDLTAEDGPVVRIENAAEIPFEVHDLSAEKQDRQGRIIRGFLDEDCRSGFATDKAPLMRLAHFTFGPEDHELIWSSHHALFDGRGRYIVLREVTEIYDALIAGRDPVLDPVRPYSDFLNWVAAKDFSVDQSFWTSKLGGMEEQSPLGLGDFDQEAGGDDLRLALRESLGRDLGNRLEIFAKSSGVTVNTLVQGAWALVLARQSGKSEVVFGAPRACRHGSVEGSEAMVGVMVNTVPVRLNLEPDDTVGAFLKDLRDLWIEMRPYEHAPLTLMRGAAGLRPDQPLFDSLVGFEGYELTDRMRRDDPRWASREATLEARTELPLTLQLYRSPEWDFVLTYDPARFPGDHAAWLAARFRTALKGLVSGADIRIGQLDIVDEAERTQVLSWGVRKGAFPNDETVHGRFASIANRYPDQDALVFGDQFWTYGELDGRSNEFAARLAEVPGVESGLVAIVGPRCPEQIMAILAVLKAGGAYLPLDPEFPDERLRLLLDEATAVCLVACGGWSADGRGIEIPIHVARREGAFLKAAPASEAGPDSAAYVMFTSGSTGRPKGVEVPHRAIMRLLFGMDYVRLSPPKSLIHLSPAAFDASTFEIWGALLLGGRCVLYPDRVPTPELLGQIIRQYDVDTLWLTCSLFNFLVDESIETFEPIRQLLTGGEALSPDHVERAVSRLPQTQLINCYGPTEATTFATTYAVPSTYGAKEGALPIGEPISNTTVLVVDSADRLAPIGCEGELLIGGPGVALGYRNRPDLTAEKFVAVEGFPGELFYRTGDRVLWRSDGNLAFVGRVDDQIKIRGFRIELGEIESELRKIQGVRRVAVILINQPGRGKLLAAGIVPDSGVQLDADQVRRDLVRQVPDFMVPAIIRVISELPLNPNGKIDRKKLGLVLATPETVTDSSHSSPSEDGVRNSILTLLKETLVLDRIDEARSFFELGGDSLGAIRFLSRASSVLGAKIPFSVVFGARSVADTVNRISGIQSLDDTSESVVPDRIERGFRIPLTSKQRSYLEISRRNPGHPTGVVGRAFRIKGTVRRSLFRKAVEWVIQRHETLRTVFERDPSGEVGQRMLPKLEVPLEFSSVPAPRLRSDEWLLGELDGQIAEGLDPFDGPLIRFRLINANRRCGALLMTSLHLVTDGSSLAIVLEDLFRAYECLLAGREPDLPPLQLQYLDFQGWHAKILDGPTMNSLREFWLRQVEHLPIPHFKVLDGDRGGDHCHGRMRYLAVDPDLTARIRNYSDQRGVTPFVACLAAFKIAVSRYAGMRDLSVGTSINLKDHPAFDGAVGDFSNLLPIRTRLNPDESLGVLCERIIEAFSATMSHRLFPKMEVRKMLPRAPSIFDDAYCPFSFTEIPPFALHLPSGLALEPLNREERDFFFVFQGNVEEKSETLEFRFTYAIKVFSEAVMDSFLTDFTMVLEHLVADSNRPMSGLPWDEGGRKDLVEVEEPVDPSAQTGSLDVGPWERFLQLLGEVLPVDPIDPGRSFVGQGGDSVLALRLAARATRAFKRPFPPSLLLDGRTIDDGFQCWQRVGNADRNENWIELETVDRFKLWPLGPKHEKYLAAIRRTPGKPISIIARAFRIEGSFSPDAWTKAVNWAVQHQEPLRTVLVPSVDGSWAQKVLPMLPVEVDVIACTGEAGDEENVLKAFVAFVGEGIDVFKGPLIESRVVQVGAAEWAVFMKVPHIACDGSALCDLMTGIGSAYNAALEDKTPELSVPELQFIDFLEWYRKYGETESAEADEAFWRDHLEGLRPVRFPGWPRSLPGWKLAQGRIRYLTIPPGLAATIRAQGRKFGLTPFKIGFATYVGLLRLYSGQNDIGVGTSINLREDPRFDGAIGDFSNPLKGRFQLTDRDTLKTVLDRVVRSLGRIMDHRYFPAPKIRQLVPEGESLLEDASKGFIFTEALDICEGWGLSGARVRLMEPAERLLPVLMSTNFIDTGDSMKLVISYAREVFSEDILECFETDFLRLIELFVEAPEKRLISFRPSWSKAGSLNPSDRGPEPDLKSRGLQDSVVSEVCDLFGDFLESDFVRPGRSFFDLGGDSVSALRLLRRVHSRFGVRIEYLQFTRDPTPQGVARVIGLAPVDRRMGEYLPVNVSHRREPEYLTDEQVANLKKALAQPNRKASGIVRAFRVKGDFDREAWEQAINLVLDRHESLRQQTRFTKNKRAQRFYLERVRIELKAEDLTGMPLDKVEDRIHLIYREESLTSLPFPVGPAWRFRAICLPRNETLLLVTVSHGVTDGLGLARIFDELGLAYRAYAVGSEPRLPEVNLQAYDLSRWLEVWKAENEPRLKAYWNKVFADGVPDLVLPFDLKPELNESCIGLYIYHHLPIELVEAVGALAEKVGTTKFSVFLTAFLVLLNRATGVDRPFATILSDARIHPDAEHVVGNFVNTVPVVARFSDDTRLINALCDVAELASKAVAHAGIPVASLLDDHEPTPAPWTNPLGRIVFNQVPNLGESLKLGGLKVEGLQRAYYWRFNSFSCYIFDHEDGSATAQLCYPSEQMSDERAQSLVARYRRIIETMVETPDCELAELGDTKERVASSQREKVISAFFAEVLGRPVRRNESFFECGGDSLTALRLIHKIRSISSVPLSYADLFNNPAPGDLAAFLEDRELEEKTVEIKPAPKLRRLPRNRDWPATDNQLVYWRLVTESGGTTTGNIVRPLRIRGPFRVSRFREAVRAVIERHEALRTGLVADGDGQVRQKILNRFRIPFSRESQPGLSETRRTAFCTREADREGQEPFDLAKPPLMRVKVVRFDRTDHFMMITVNHAVTDGTSLGILWNDLARAYAALGVGREPGLKPMRLQYVDVSAWQTRVLLDGREEELKRYWEENLVGMSRSIPFPLDGRPGKRRARPGFILEHRFESTLTDRLRALGQRHGVSLYGISLASFKLVLRAFSGADDLTVSSAVDCRACPEASEVVGHFANRIIIRSQVDDSATLVDFINQVSRNLARALDHRQFPSRRALAFVPADKNGRRIPDDYVFNQAPKAGRHLDLGNAVVSPVVRRKARPNTILGLTWKDLEDEGMSVELFYARALFKPETLARIFSVWERILEQMAADPLEPVSTILGRLAVRAEDAMVQTTVRTRFEEALGLNDVSESRSFFELGGDSLAAARLVSRLSADFGVGLPFDLLETQGSIQAITHVLQHRLDTDRAALSQEANRTASRRHRRRLKPVRPTTDVPDQGSTDKPVLSIPIVADRGPQPLAPQVAANWRRNFLGEDRFPHSITRAYRLQGGFDRDAYDRALVLVIGRHEALRVMHRCLADGGVERVVLDSFELKTSVTDLAGETGSVALERARKILDQESVEPLELTEGVPVRSRIIRLSPTDHVIMLTFYHGLVDGIGLSVVLEELSAAYDAFVCGRLPRLAPVKVQAMDYAGWLKSWIKDHESGLKPFWNETFAKGIPEIRLCLDSDERPTGTTAGLLQRLLLPADLMSRVETRARYHGVSRFRYLFAGAFLMFARDPQTDVRMLMTIVNARRHPEAESVVGPFIEGVPVIVPDLVEMYVGQAVETVGMHVNEVIAHALPGVVLMGRQVLEQEGREDNPFGLVYFNQVPDLESALNLKGLAVEPWLREHIAMRGMLGITTRDQPDGSTFVQLNHPVSVLSKERGMRLLEGFRDTVVWMLEHPDGTVAVQVGDEASRSNWSPDQEKAGSADEDSTLQRVMEIFERSLGRAISPDSSFFAAGGDSLMAATLLHRANREFDIRLAFRAFEEASTPLEFANVIRSQLNTGRKLETRKRVATIGGRSLVRLPRPVKPELVPDPPSGVRFRNLGQRYMICRAFDVGRGFDPDLFEEAFRRVVVRHDALRRCFRRDKEGRIWLAVRGDPKLKIDRIDLSHLPADELEAKVAEHYDSDSRRPLKPYSGVMHRVTILRCGPDRSVIIFTFCHRFVDGISVFQVLSETSRIYQALADGRSPDLPSVDVQDSDLEVWLDKWNESEQSRLVSYWRNVLGRDVPPRLYEVAPVANRLRRSKGRFLNFTVPTETMDQVRRMASSVGCTTHYVVLATSHVFFQRWLGVGDLITSSVADLRLVPEAEGVVGNFVSNTPMRVCLGEEDSLADVVKRVSRIGREAMDHRSPKVGPIIRAVLDEIGYAGSPLGCIYLNQVPDTYQALDLGSIPVRAMLREGLPGYSFGFSHRFRRNGSMGLQVQFPIHKITAERFEPLLKDWRLILESIASKPSLLVGQLQRIGQDRKLA